MSDSWLEKALLDKNKEFLVYEVIFQNDRAEKLRRNLEKAESKLIEYKKFALDHWASRDMWDAMEDFLKDKELEK